MRAGQLKKAECQRINAFELRCWRRPLRVPWTTRRSNQSILREINPEYHWKDWCWSSNTLTTWYEELTHLKRPWYWERLKSGGEGDGRGWDGWIASLTQWTWVWANSGRWWRTGKAGVQQSMRLQRVGHDWATEWQLGGGWAKIAPGWEALFSRKVHVGLHPEGLQGLVSASFKTEKRAQRQQQRH